MKLSLKTVRTLKDSKTIAVITLSMLVLNNALCADRFWIGEGNWNDTANWSDTSGGDGGATLPSTADTAFFDENSGDCTLNININVKGVSLAEGYSGTITQEETRKVTIGALHYSQAGGTFIGGTNSFTLTDGNFALSGGKFMAGEAQSITVSRDVIIAAPVFEAGSSTFLLRNTGATMLVTNTATGNINFHQLSLGNYSGSTTRNINIANGTTLVVHDKLMFKGNKNITLDGQGLLIAKGDVSFDNMSYNAGTAELLIAGNENQTLSSNGAYIPIITVDKPSGMLNLEGTLRVEKNLSFLAGEVVAAPDSTVEFRQNLTITGSVELANVLMGNLTVGTTTIQVTLTGDTVITVKEKLEFKSTTSGRVFKLDGSGHVEARGDILFDGANYPDGLLIVNGSEDQSWSCKGATVPALTIDKPSGTLYLSGTTVVSSAVNYLGCDIDPGTSTVNFEVPRGSPGLVISNTVPLELYSAIIGKSTIQASTYGDAPLQLINGSILNIRNNLRLSNGSGSGALIIKHGFIHLYGNLNISYNSQGSVFKATDNSFLLLTGDNDQILRTAAGAEKLMELPLFINKTGGQCLIDNNFTFGGSGQNINFDAGTLNLHTNKITLSGNNASFLMSPEATLMTTINTTNNGMISVTGTGAAFVDGNLALNVSKHYLPPKNYTNFIITANSGPIENTPFKRELIADNYRCQTHYNINGNNVFVTDLRYTQPASVIIIQ